MVSRREKDAAFSERQRRVVIIPAIQRFNTDF